MPSVFRPTLLLSTCLACLVALLWLTSCSEPEEFADLPDEIDFNLHIKPILSDRCFKCHGPDTNSREANLRLDTEEGALRAVLESGGHAIVPGSLRRSALFQRITTSDPEELMPPSESNLALSPREIALIRRWIKQGASWKPHWAFIPPGKPPLPDVTRADWPANEIDRFILHELEARGLSPQAPADRETLLRRLSLDLTGLPPALDELDFFLADASPKAYERAVDRLLASPHYGERMAVEWLDVARYADSHGYQDDGMRTMWPWRDWVIEAFNRNLPFDQFVTWQMAGDLLPNPTREQLLATGFNRNHMQSQEGGIVLEEYRVEYVADRTHTTGKALLGLTMECARCHDHKYDPVSMEEYYRMFAFFNNINEVGNIPYAGEASPTLTLPTPEAENALESLREEIESKEAAVDIHHSSYDAGFRRWLQSTTNGRGDQSITPAGLVAVYPLDGWSADFRLVNSARAGKPATLVGDRDRPPTIVEGKTGKALLLSGESFVDVGKDFAQNERHEPFSIALWVNVHGAQTEGPIFARTTGLFDGNRGFILHLDADGRLTATMNHVLPDNSLEVRTRERIRPGAWRQVVMTYDGSSRASGLKLFLDGAEAPVDALVDNLRHSILYTKHVVTGARTNWGGHATLRLGTMGVNQTTLDSVAVDDFRIFDRRLTGLEVAALHGRSDTLSALLAVPENRRTEAQNTALRDTYVTRSSPEWRRAFADLTAARGRENELMTDQTQVMILRERSETRQTFLLARGAYDAPETPVEPGTPAVLPAFPDDLPRNRLGLARWLTDPRNPLPARVTVNRYWQMLFGRGLVDTPDDFGNQGSMPSHPALLDWLAVSFVDSGWDVRHLIRQMVLSSTYRQSSLSTPELREIDPENRLLARGPSHRLAAETLRDQALAASGLLVREIGGPPVKPYQPDGLWEELATRNEVRYVQDTGDKLYRRSLYTIWKRTTPPPSMISFDAAERNVCTVQRQRTNTPLQALVLLNDPQFVEAARVLAERMIREGGSTAAERVSFAYRLLTSRRPPMADVQQLIHLVEEELAAYRVNPKAARDLLSVGEFPADRSLPPAEVAAYAIAAATLLNFDAAVYRR